MSRRLLAVSNGHGEDLIAAEILRHLRGVDVTVFPLVGLGEAYPPTLPRLEPRRVFPSGGFAFRHGQPSLADDLRSGFIRFWFAQRRTLAEQRGGFDLVLAVGDLYCLMMASRAGGGVALVASADSVLNAPFSRLQVRLLRRRARRVFTRDEPTATYLESRGLDAAYLGNVMIDCLRVTGVALPLPPEAPLITLLPGSRAEATRNAVLLAQVAAGIARARPDAGFALALAPTVDDAAMAEALAGAGWTARDGEATSGPVRLVVTRAFADAVTRSVVVVGLAGTANEQAAGLGKPVVAFPGEGPQFTAAFLDMQQRLLGQALVSVPSPHAAVEAVLRLLDAPEERSRRGGEGIARMGGRGAAARIAAALEELLVA